MAFKFVTGKSSYGVTALAIVNLSPSRTLHIEGRGTFSAPRHHDPVWRVDWNDRDDVPQSTRGLTRSEAVALANGIVANERNSVVSAA